MSTDGSNGPVNSPSRAFITRLIITAAVFLVLAAPANAQPNCKKGIPCGNSCIAATKTCRIGTTQPSPRPDTALHRGALSAEDQQTLISRITQTPGASQLFVGSVDGSTYYLASCLTAQQKLTPDERVVFFSEREAIAAGYKRSRAKGC